MITLSLYLGLRPGEAAGLTWGAIQLDATPPVLHVTHSLQRIAEQMVLGPVKTPTSDRTIALPPACVTALERQTELQALERHKNRGEWKNPLDLVFTTEVGTPLNPPNVRRGVHAVATRAGLGHFHPHLLRHAAASLMSAAGTGIEDIADTLGHRSIIVAAVTYRHPIAVTRDRHLGAIEELLDDEEWITAHPDVRRRRPNPSEVRRNTHIADIYGVKPAQRHPGTGRRLGDTTSPTCRSP